MTGTWYTLYASSNAIANGSVSLSQPWTYPDVPADDDTTPLNIPSDVSRIPWRKWMHAVIRSVTWIDMPARTRLGTGNNVGYGG